MAPWMSNSIEPILVSIYMPTKDRLDLVRAAIQSVLAQTYRPLELIVVNDGSSDGTRAYLDQLASSNAFVRAIHHEKPLGAPRSRNEAIKAARGEWVTGLDDDDEFEPHRIEALLQFALMLERIGTPFSAVYSQYNTVRGAKVRPTAKCGSVQLEDLFERNSVGNQIFIRREAMMAAGMFDESLPAWQDLDMIMRVVAMHGPARIFDAPLYRFCDDERPDRISRKAKAKILDAYRRVIAKWPNAPKRSQRALYQQVFGEHYGFPIGWADLRRYLALGASPLEFLRMCRTGWRRRRLNSALRTSS
jgi:glycosyltransferase involved in cell wall biosynthesis